ncbi:MAG: outer membrane lipoprotein LolB [Succinivibrio sp.]|nr:outer membrane lipoprotein LolB [Succinivibrio sp.]
MIKRLTALFLTALMLGSCAFLGGCQSALDGREVSAQSGYWADMYHKLGRITHYKLYGRIGLITEDGRVSGQFYLTALPDGYMLELSSPLGTSVAELTVSGEHVTFKTEDLTLHDEAALRLFSEEFNLRVPPRSLRQIMLGLPGGEVVTDAQGRIVSSHTDDYDIVYEEPREFNGYALPLGLSATREDLTMKLKIYDVLELEER